MKHTGGESHTYGKPTTLFVTAISIAALCALLLAQQKPASTAPQAPTTADKINITNAQRMVDQGRHIFRFDTFGSETLWGDALQLHKAIAGEKNGGIGPGVSPKTALSVGLKVDVDALPADLVASLK